VVPRFSHMGYAAVALLAATGAINTLLLVGNVDSPAGTPYGRLLSLKILLFSVMVVLALINPFRLLPRLRERLPRRASLEVRAAFQSN
jgi:putative copper resistance protein D